MNNQSERNRNNIPGRKTRAERVREIREERDARMARGSTEVRSADRTRTSGSGTQRLYRGHTDMTEDKSSPRNNHRNRQESRTRSQGQQNSRGNVRHSQQDTRARSQRSQQGSRARGQRDQQNVDTRGQRGQQRKNSTKNRRRRSSVPLRILGLLLAIVVLFVVIRVVRRITSGIGPDKTAPIITLNHDPEYTVMPGQLYKEEGFTATDDRDGDLTDKVERIEEDDRIQYRVADSAGNVTVSYREIPWMPGSDPALAEAFQKDEGGKVEGKVVYLTFDDGPGQYTQRLLDTLEKNGVKATFFVTGAFPVYEDLIKKEYEAGHSVGIHTQSHDYDKIYSSTDAFWEDNNRMQEIIVRQTGVPTSLMRFAGGSSNTMGTWQVPDIMEQLVKQARERKLQYFDWNVSSGDGAAEGDSAMVISRITDQIRNQDESVVLCHDTKEYTVNAMEYLIPWLLDNGYEIRPLTAESFPAHHIELD